MVGNCRDKLPMDQGGHEVPVDEWLDSINHMAGLAHRPQTLLLAEVKLASDVIRTRLAPLKSWQGASICAGLRGTRC